jgi:glutamate dehydrogenase
MSDTSSTAIERLRREQPALEAVQSELRRLVDGTDQDLAIRFAEIFFSKAPPGFLQERSTPVLARMVLGAFRFLQRSRPDRVDVDVMNPDVDTEGWFAPVTVIRTNVSERPFIVDTIREYLHAEDLAIEVYIYPVLHVNRDAEGRIVDLRPSREADARESLVHCETTRVSDPARLERIGAQLRSRLRDVVLATDDFRPMLEQVDRTIQHLEETARRLPDRRDEVDEVRAFLEWLKDGGFVFLGYRGYDIVEDRGKRCIQVEKSSGLGILRSEKDSSFARPVPVESLPRGLQPLVESGPLLIISKTNAAATVHRRARMDYIGVKKIDETGAVVGERRFIGLFTSEAYSEKADRIPILRRKLDRILEESGVQAGSHDYKEIHTIFNTLPKEELFLTSTEEIGADVRTVLTTFDTDEVRVTIRRDPLLRGISVMVILAKEKFSGEVRKQIEEAFVELLNGEVLNYHLALGEGDQARLHFFLAAAPERLEEVSSRHLEEVVRRLIRSWADRLREGLERVRPAEEARRLARTYGRAFSREYQAATDADVAVSDILEMEAMEAEGRPVSITLSNPRARPAVAGGDPVTELKLYLRETRLVLSDFMPILENCGIRVIAVTPFEVRGAGVAESILYSFVVQGPDHAPLDIQAVGSRLAETILAVREGDATNDRLNALVITAGLAWREVDVLRAYAAFGFQVGAVPSRLSLPIALRKHPEIARLLFRLFEVRFQPGGPASTATREGEVAAVRRQIQSALAGVTGLSDDRALRRLTNLIDSTLRTNYYRNGGEAPTRRSGGVPYISFKFDCASLIGPARTRLRSEIWVRSSRMEGVHLRGARVARGGIRYSDRPDDFRSEVLGLVKTQMVKNAVIVPGGSKGGFVTLRTLSAAEMATEAEEQYKTLIRGMLDLTDNLRGGRPEPPEAVYCYDEPDPYLVVAADKGTAKFSDVANAVAAEYDFWLGDAFASGGSNGYDHKKVGITARGAWECVKRHFQEMGKDTQTEPFTVVGIGDMSGDVFGNGMLLSRQIRLLAAFDHRDVFIDPDPDPEASYRERERLFRMGRSSWQDYDRELLSPGGMIIPRGSKEVQLTPQALDALGIEEDPGPVDGETLIRAVLRVPAELLWNGGIGTYVKASGETHAEVGDASNDAVRIDASELRCAVVGEGGNLGLTQRARIDYALAGGRINSDAIDNSGGVDLSDREVNLKILLLPTLEEGRLDVERRNELLRELAEPVSRLVLADNQSQSLAVSLEALRAEAGIDDLRELMSGLERAGLLDRAGEHLPTWETLVERQEEGKSFTRPEVAVLLAYAKLHLTAHILRSDLPDDPAVGQYLRDYFPPAALVEAGDEGLEGHRLRREIVVSQLTNDLVDMMGASFIHRVHRGTGRTVPEIARAWVIASRLIGHRELAGRLRLQKPGLPLFAAYRWLLGLGRVLERTTRWLLNNEEVLARDTSEVVEENLGGLARLREAFPDIVSGEDRRIFNRLVEELHGDGADEGFARSLITLRFLDQLLEILRVHRRTGADPLDAARTFYRVADLFWIPWLRQAIFDGAGDDRWQRRAAQALSDDLTWAHQRLVAAVMRLRRGTDSVESATEQLSSEHRELLDRYLELLREIEADERIGLPALTVAVRELMSLAERVQVAEETAAD